jgi:serine/threonine protein kinase
MTRGSITLNETVEIGIQLCEALSEAHGKGVIHRDLKPQNIFIDETGRATLMDFGISRLATLTGLTRGSQLMGTPRYMSPEQVSGGKKELDHRSDIYSLGIVLYELSTNQVPFSGEAPVEVAMRHIQEAPRPPRERNARIPVSLEKLILTCLEKDPASRYDSARALGTALKAVAQDVGIDTQSMPSFGSGLDEREATPSSRQALVSQGGEAEAPTLGVSQSPTTSRRHGVTIRTKAKGVKWLAVGLFGAAVIAALGLLWMFAFRGTPGESILLEEGDNAERSEPSPAGEAEATSGGVTYRQPPGESDRERATSATPVATSPVSLPVSISANPGTSIYVDGKHVGTVPPRVQVELTEGKHRIRYVIPGYDEHEETVTVGSKEGNSFSHQFSAFCVLRVVCQPYASVRLNGRDVGYTPVNLDKVREGEHRLVLHREGYETIEESVTVRPGQINRFQYSLVRR